MDKALYEVWALSMINISVVFRVISKCVLKSALHGVLKGKWNRQKNISGLKRGSSVKNVSYSSSGPRLVLSHHTGKITTAYTSGFRGSKKEGLLLSSMNTLLIYIYPHTSTQIPINT